MNNDPLLRQRLSALVVPEPDPAARERALDEALRALRATPPDRPPVLRDPRRSWLAAVPRWTLAAGAAAVVILLAISAVTLSVHRTTGQKAPAATAERTVLSEMETLFGTQLDAVVERPDGPPEIRLSTDSDAGAQPSLAQPVLIEFRRDGRETTRVFSYSGRDVCVTLAGRRTCFEPLVTGGGEVILAGERFYWNSRQPAGELDGYRVAARPLPRS